MSLEDSPFQQYKTKTTALETFFFLDLEDLKELNRTCPVERELKGPDKCSGSYNNAVFNQFPPFAYKSCQCHAQVKEETLTVETMGEEMQLNANGQMEAVMVTKYVQEPFTNFYMDEFIAFNGAEPTPVTMTEESDSPCMFKFKINKGMTP